MAMGGPECRLNGLQVEGGYFELTKKRAADLGDSLDPEAAELLRRAMYVDDLCGGGTTDQVERFRGVYKDGKFTGTLPKILDMVGLQAKVILTSGEKNSEILEKYGGKVLGHGWDPTRDVISFEVPVNLSKRNRKGERLEPDLATADIPRLPSLLLTKRKLLGLVMSIFDVSGLLSPVTIKLKLKLKKLFRNENVQLTWDDEIPADLHPPWVKLLTELLSMPRVEVPRSVKPKDSIGSPELFIFFDGSTDAYGASVYVRHHTETGFQSSLLIAKARVTTVRGTTTPKSELSGLLIASRLLLTVLRSMPEKPSEVFIAGDSQCTIAALEKSGDQLGPYFCNRVSEILQNLDEAKNMVDGIQIHPVYHVAGIENPADLIT